MHESSWWDQAQMRDVARAYETAVTFRDEDQAARDAESRIRQELRERYDVEVLETGADPAVGRATLVDRDAERVERDERQAQARDDQALAAGLVVGAEVLEVSADLADADEAQDLRDLEHDAELSWDSAERRELHVEGIKAGPDQARDPREAVRGVARASRRALELPRRRPIVRSAATADDVCWRTVDDPCARARARTGARRARRVPLAPRRPSRLRRHGNKPARPRVEQAPRRRRQSFRILATTERVRVAVRDPAEHHWLAGQAEGHCRAGRSDPRLAARVRTLLAALLHGTRG